MNDDEVTVRRMTEKIAGEITTARSLLNKPLGKLTEEDIAQLTREDCRRYLKDKGMRRPSWNKSQAIQQVICLKALLEGGPDNVAGEDPPIPIWPREVAPPAPLDSTSPSSCRRIPNTPPAICDLAAAEISTCGRLARGTPHVRERQLTVFYGGKVTVYNGVPPDKALAILQVAGSRDEPDPSAVTVPVQSNRPVQKVTASRSPSFPAPVTDCQPSRKASLRRYLQKRKDRGKFKCKRILEGFPPTMEMMYLHPQFKSQIPHELLPSWVDTSGQMQPRPPSTPPRCSSSESQNMEGRALFNLNDDWCGN